jgi:hypothetical protein
MGRMGTVRSYEKYKNDSVCRFQERNTKANNKEGSKDNQALSEIDITLSFINMCLIPVLRNTYLNYFPFLVTGPFKMCHLEVIYTLSPLS